MLCHLIEEVIPKEYYTTMISLTADINLILLFLREKHPKLLTHFGKINFELPMVLVEQFITAFTNNNTDITELIMDRMLIDGSITYFKVILLFFKYFEKELLTMTEFCIFGVIKSRCCSSSKINLREISYHQKNSKKTFPSIIYPSFSSRN